MELCDRIKEIRKTKNLTQTEFGTVLGVSRAVINTWERGAVSPNDMAIQMLCVRFGVNEEWLVNGIGEMFPEKTSEEELIEAFGAILNDDDTFRKKFISVLAQLDENGWNAIEEFCKKVVAPPAEKEKDGK